MELVTVFIDNSWSVVVKEQNYETVVAGKCGFMGFFSPFKMGVIAAS